MTAAPDILRSEREALRLLFEPLRPLVGFDAVAAVLCFEKQDYPLLFTTGAVDQGFAEALADDLVDSVRRFSGDSHAGCARGPLQIVPLARDKTPTGPAWKGPALSSLDAPLIVKGRVMGLVRVIAAGENAFEGEKSTLVYAAAHQASSLLESRDEARADEKERSQSLVDGLEDGVIVLGRDMRPLLLNKAAKKLLDAYWGRGATSLEQTPLAALAQQALEQGGDAVEQEFVIGEDSQRRLSVRATLLDEAGGEGGILLVLRDVTEEHLMQERLLQSEKMASVGQLVSGVAHELNNPLTGVTGFAQLLLARDLDAQTRRDVETIYGEAQRAAKIVENLLAFARRRKAQKGLVDLNALLERVLELRSYDLRVKNIDLELDLDPRLPRTMADPDQIQQVFFNIITNAEHSMLSARGKGKLRVRSRADKGFVRLTFADDGVGIPPENVRRVFDPFFTTKEGGQGTGLGLTISYGIIDEHGGRIRVESRPGKGAAFTVELPIVSGPELPAPEPETPHAAPVEVSRRILVVDDEESILTLLTDVLTGDGHRVDRARNGDEAAALLAKYAYDLLITDIKMPGMSGQALYRHVKEMDSELAKNTVFITGDTVSAETRTFLQRIDNPCLPKPFSIGDVRKVVRQILGEGS
ncbi:MAG: ATP-binding protein [Dehalococcoidia bacterium]|nr:ATP-binding protein [Dehalococcoidia bacterium]